MSSFVAGLTVLMVVFAAALAALGAYLLVKKPELPLGKHLAVIILWGGAAGLVALAVLAGQLAVAKMHREARAGWNLVPVLTASRDLAAGAPLSEDALVERTVPEQFVTRSIYRTAERGEIVGRTLVAPAKRGEMISHFLVGRELAGCGPALKR